MMSSHQPGCHSESCFFCNSHQPHLRTTISSIEGIIQYEVALNDIIEKTTDVDRALRRTGYDCWYQQYPRDYTPPSAVVASFDSDMICAQLDAVSPDRCEDGVCNLQLGHALMESLWSQNIDP